MKTLGITLIATAALTYASAGLAADAGSAPAGAATRVGVVSLVGQELSVVQRESMVGTNVDKNARSSSPLVSDGVRKAMIQALARGMSAKCQPCDFSMIDPAQGWEATVNQIRNEEPAQLATRLDVLVTKSTREQFDRIVVIAPRRLHDFATGHGTLWGIGYYTDAKRSVAGNLIAPFAFLQAVMVDAKTGKVLGSDVVGNYRKFEDTQNKGLQPFEILPENELREAFVKLLDETMSDVGNKLMVADNKTR